MRLDQARRDLYRRLAKEQGYKSRAAFKLMEANERYGFIRRGGKIVDLGSAPGGWLQVAAEFVGPEGLVVGVDIGPIRVKGENIAVLKMDVNDPLLIPRLEEMLGGKADAILSDLSPSVTGVWELDQTRQVELTLKVLDLARGLLKESGAVFCKLFEGERSQEVRNEFRRMFKSVRVVKPAASRNASSELYYCCEGLKEEVAT
jgi:23S rRNA (uridine2552-2'-O)-methyltransferase